MENYLRERNKDTEAEVPLAIVGDQEYIYYEKGAINMYAFQEWVGETKPTSALEKARLALKNYDSFW